ncbi:hypothetical protein ACFLSQ_09520 [Bacteroidota bacterium]
MKRILLIIMSVFLFSSCDIFEDDYDDFIDAYKNIIVTREKFKNDSVKAEQEIQKIYKIFGFTTESFKEEYFDLANEKPRRFYELIDSIRERAKRELIEYQNKAGKENQIEDE